MAPATFNWFNWLEPISKFDLARYGVNAQRTVKKRVNLSAGVAHLYFSLGLHACDQVRERLSSLCLRVIASTCVCVCVEQIMKETLFVKQWIGGGGRLCVLPPSALEECPTSAGVCCDTRVAQLMMDYCHRTSTHATLMFI